MRLIKVVFIIFSISGVMEGNNEQYNILMKSVITKIQQKNLVYQQQNEKLRQTLKQLKRKKQERLKSKNILVLSNQKIQTNIQQNRSTKVEQLKKQLRQAEEQMINKNNLLQQQAQKLQKIDLDIQSKQRENQSLSKQNNYWLRQISKEQIQNKELKSISSSLLQKLQERKNNIRVYCRIKQSDKQQKIIHVNSQQSLDLIYYKLKYDNRQQRHVNEFSFEHIFTEDYTQQEVYHQLCPLIQSSLQGKHVSFITYGQTGSGKTFTLLGHTSKDNINTHKTHQTNQTLGLVPRSLNTIFEIIELQRQLGLRYEIRLSIVQIYLQNLYNLINQTSNQVKQNECLSKKKNNQVPQFQKIIVNNTEQATVILQTALNNRRTRTTKMNYCSSRSHLIISLDISKINSEGQTIAKGSVHFIDLAGTQKLDTDSKKGDRSFNQTTSINKSLSGFRSVIFDLNQKGSSLKYSSCLLTKYLKQYFTSKNKIILIVNITPDLTNLHQSKSTLQFSKTVLGCQIQRQK